MKFNHMMLFLLLSNYCGLAIEIIDITPLIQSTILERNSYVDSIFEVSKQIDVALSNEGVFIATISDELFVSHVDSINAARSLFSLPLSSKESVSMSALDNIARGYIGFGSEAGVSSYFEPKEGYSYGRHHKDNSTSMHYLQLPNIWPADFAIDNIAIMDHVFNRLVRICEVITESIQLIEYSNMNTCKFSDVGLECNNKELNQDIIDYKEAIVDGDAISIMRLFHYLPKNDSISSKKQIGSSPHTDWGFLTVILHDQTQGLQFFHNKTWQDVPIIQNSFVINAGDFLNLLSRGRYRSPIHRVLCPPPHSHRTSFVLFFYPNHKCSLLRPVRGPANVNTSFKYNTLTEAGVNNINETFGDYIIKKWRGVSMYK